MYDRKKAFKNPVCEESICGNTPDVEVKNISLKNLIEYADKKFSRLSGRDQPFLAYTDEVLEELVQSISLNGIINVYYYNMFGCGSRATSPASFHLVPKL